MIKVPARALGTVRGTQRRQTPLSGIEGVQAMAEAHLIVYVCPKCGKRTKALPRADIWCPCGRKMKQEKPGSSERGRA